MLSPTRACCAALRCAGELAYHSHELFSEEEGRLVAELEAQQRECASLQLAVFKMREQARLGGGLFGGWLWEPLFD